MATIYQDAAAHRRLPRGRVWVLAQPTLSMDDLLQVQQAPDILSCAALATGLDTFGPLSQVIRAFSLTDPLIFGFDRTMRQRSA